MVKTVVPLTELDEVEKRGLIHVPKELKKDYTPMSTTGVVLAVGEGLKYDVYNKATQTYCRMIEEGEMVMFPRVAGMDFSMNGVNDYRILHVNDILAVLVDTDESVVEVKGSDIEEGTGNG